MVEVEEVKETVENPTEAKALVRSIKTTFETYLKLNKRIPPEILMRVSTIEDVGELGDIIVAQLNLKLEDIQKILEQPDPAQSGTDCQGPEGRWQGGGVQGHRAVEHRRGSELLSQRWNPAHGAEEFGEVI